MADKNTPPPSPSDANAPTQKLFGDTAEIPLGGDTMQVPLRADSLSGEGSMMDTQAVPLRKETVRVTLKAPTSAHEARPLSTNTAAVSVTAPPTSPTVKLPSAATTSPTMAKPTTKMPAAPPPAAKAPAPTAKMPGRAPAAAAPGAAVAGVPAGREAKVESKSRDVTVLIMSIALLLVGAGYAALEYQSNTQLTETHKKETSRSRSIR